MKLHPLGQIYNSFKTSVSFFRISKRMLVLWCYYGE